jgi:hypothetical protein
VKLPVAVEKLAFPPKRPNLGIASVSGKRESRLYGILTRFYFREFLGSEFFNGHACLKHLRSDSPSSAKWKFSRPDTASSRSKTSKQ